MRYMGGKTRIARHLAAVIDSVRRPGQPVWDAFCGGLSMSNALSRKGPVWSTDANAALIALYRAVQAGWDPPTEVSRREWAEARRLPDADPLKAFCGFGCSWGGKWFGGYAGGLNGRLTCAQLAARNVEASARRAGAEFEHVDFLAVTPRPIGDAILYLDPPYAGTTPYAGAAPFDHARFVDHVRGWSRYAMVFVSEYAFPIGECVWERASRGTLGLKHGKTHVERLFFVYQET